MATKKKEEDVCIEPIKECTMTLHLIGDSPLILCKRSRSFEREEIFKQGNKKGTQIPDNLNSKDHFCLWEKLITSIIWEKEDEVPVHENYEDYTEEEYLDLMKNNRPCILSTAFRKSFSEMFVTVYKEKTGRNGTDFKRCLSFEKVKNPIDFTSFDYIQRLVPNNTIAHTNVLTQHSTFYGWSCNLTVSFITSVFPKETIISLINTTGKNIGVGSRRNDGYGAYHIGDVLINN